MRTLLANMKHAAQQGYVTPIGGGTFSPAELRVAIETIRDATETLAQLAFTVETVAHLRGMELELLPVADKARAIVARMEAD